MVSWEYTYYTITYLKYKSIIYHVNIIYIVLILVYNDNVYNIIV